VGNAGMNSKAPRAAASADPRAVIPRLWSGSGLAYAADVSTEDAEALIAETSSAVVRIS